MSSKATENGRHAESTTSTEMAQMGGDDLKQTEQTVSRLATDEDADNAEVEVLDTTPSWIDRPEEEDDPIADINEEISLIIDDATSRSSTAPPPSSRLYRHRTFSTQNSFDDVESTAAAVDELEPRPQHHRSSSIPELLLGRLLSTLTAPFRPRRTPRSKKLRARRNRRTQTDSVDTAAAASGKKAKSSSPLRLAKSFVSVNRPNSGGCRSLLRRLPLPVAITCFVFLFVIQFRANQHAAYVQSAGVLPAAAVDPASSPSLASSTNLTSDTNSPQSSPVLRLPVIDDGTGRDLQAMPTSSAEVIVNTSQSAAASKPPCPLIPPNLVGRLKVLRHPPPMAELEAQLSAVQVGGRYTPPNCTPKFKVAIIVPYRDREEHLRTFLWNLHPMLMRQNIEYGIFIVEQSGEDRFNRAKLMNVGFLEARNHNDYDCFIFHDVDLIPEDDRNLYTCPEQPRHMSVAIDKFRYRLPYKDLFGGVSALTRQQFETINGFSNEFWGWGGEDDDMSNRVRHHKFNITRYPADIARYTMLKHEQDAPNADRYKKLYNGWRRFASDGINSTKYIVLDTNFKKLYTWLLVDVFPPPMAKKKSRRELAENKAKLARQNAHIHTGIFRRRHF